MAEIELLMDIEVTVEDVEEDTTDVETADRVVEVDDKADVDDLSDVDWTVVEDPDKILEGRLVGTVEDGILELGGSPSVEPVEVGVGMEDGSADAEVPIGDVDETDGLPDVGARGLELPWTISRLLCPSADDWLDVLSEVVLVFSDNVLCVEAV